MKACSIFVCFILTITAQSSLAQKSLEDSMRDLNNQRRTMQLESERFEQQQQLLQLQHRQQFLRSQKLIDDMNRQRAQWQAEEESDKLRQAIIRSEIAAKEQAQIIKDAEAVAEEYRDQANQSNINLQNHIYLFIFLALCAGFVFYITKRAKREGVMKPHEKFGILTIVISMLLALLSITLSTGWNPKFDFGFNLMSLMQIEFWQMGEEWEYPKSYLIDFPTKYAIFIFIATSAYGFTTYLGITPHPKKKSTP